MAKPKRVSAKAKSSKSKQTTLKLVSTTTKAKQDKLITRVCPKPAFLQLLKQIKNAQGEMDDYRAEMGGLVSAAVKSKHLNKRAFAIFRTLDKMSELKREETMRQLLMYGSHAGWDDQEDLFDKIQLVDPKKSASLEKVQPSLEFRSPDDQKGNGKERDVTKPDPAAARKALDLPEPEKIAGQSGDALTDAIVKTLN